jgi:hypothetical protein
MSCELDYPLLESFSGSWFRPPPCHDLLDHDPLCLRPAWWHTADPRCCTDPQGTHLRCLFPKVKMLSVRVVLFLALCTWPATQALQVTPNSACAQICMGSSSQNASPTDVSSTSGSDIVCKDDDYSQSAVGQSFEDCINCLQNSTAVDAGESDQASFLCE